MFIPELYRPGSRTASEIADAVEGAIATHRLAPGDRLPTIRRLSQDLGVSPTTVAAAYRTLAQRGMVVGEGRQGTRVSAGPPVPARRHPDIPASARDLARGNPDPRLLPAWGPLLHRMKPPDLQYGKPAVLPGLGELALAAFVEEGIHPDRVAMVSGALDGVERVLAAHLRPGDRVAVEDPGFPRLFDLCGALGLVTLPVAVDDAGMLPDALDEQLGAGRAAGVILTPRAQNPPGAALDTARARALRKVLAGYPEPLLVEDDHAGAIAGAPVVTTVDRRRARWAVVRSLAKSLGPDIRLAFLAADRLTLDRVEGRQRVGPDWVSHLLQQLALDLLRDRATTNRLAVAADTYTERRDALIAALGRHGITAVGRSGLNVWVPVDDEDVVVAGMLARGWALAPGSRFRLSSPPGLRVTVASLPARRAPRLAADLAEVVLAPPSVQVTSPA
jgi:DNA-binding transcriptional MocR family regulator